MMISRICRALFYCSGILGLGCLWMALAPTAISQWDRDRDREAASDYGGMPQGRYPPPGQRPPSGVRLGIYSRNMPTGVVVTRVGRNSLAERVGLEPNDVILTVGGYQVGIVDGRTLTDRERNVWQRELSKGKPTDEILSTILCSSEYYDRFRGNRPAYITEAFGYINGRNPTPAEMQRWLNRMDQLRDVRFTMIQEMMRDRGR